MLARRVVAVLVGLCVRVCVLRPLCFGLLVFDSSAIPNPARASSRSLRSQMHTNAKSRVHNLSIGLLVGVGLHVRGQRRVLGRPGHRELQERDSRPPLEVRRLPCQAEHNRAPDLRAHGHRGGERRHRQDHASPRDADRRRNEKARAAEQCGLGRGRGSPQLPRVRVAEGAAPRERRLGLVREPAYGCGVPRILGAILVGEDDADRGGRQHGASPSGARELLHPLPQKNTKAIKKSEVLQVHRGKSWPAYVDPVELVRARVKRAKKA